MNIYKSARIIAAFTTACTTTPVLPPPATELPNGLCGPETTLPQPRFLPPQAGEPVVIFERQSIYLGQPDNPVRIVYVYGNYIFITNVHEMQAGYWYEEVETVARHQFRIGPLSLTGPQNSHYKKVRVCFEEPNADHEKTQWYIRR